MNEPHTRVLRRIVMIAVAAALAAPTVATAGGRDQRAATVDPVVRNDFVHFGRSATAERLNRYELNDRAHFGSEPAAPTSSATQGPAPVVVRVGGGFDWISAGVGAAGTLGITLAAIAGLSALRRRNRIGALST